MSFYSVDIFYTLKDLILSIGGIEKRVVSRYSI